MTRAVAAYGTRRIALAGLLVALVGCGVQIAFDPLARTAEECIQQAKGEAGLDQYQVRTWRAWYAHITLSMLALTWLVASKAQAEKRGSAPATRA